MKTVAYLRVSTAQQDAGSQRLAILEYARRQGFRIDDFIEATASARTNAKHRRLDQLMAVLEPGDRLVVSELSRLGRSLGEVVALLDAIAKASVVFVAVKENIRFEGRQDLQTKVMTTLFALFAEVERDLISERTREGLAKARASGKKLGRPKGSLGVSRLDGREDEIRHFLNLGVSKSSIAKITGVTRPTLYNFIATRALKAGAWNFHTNVVGIGGGGAARYWAAVRQLTGWFAGMAAHGGCWRNLQGCGGAAPEIAARARNSLSGGTLRCQPAATVAARAGLNKSDKLCRQVHFGPFSLQPNAPSTVRHQVPSAVRIVHIHSPTSGTFQQV